VVEGPRFWMNSVLLPYSANTRSPELIFTARAFPLKPATNIMAMASTGKITRLNFVLRLITFLLFPLSYNNLVFVVTFLVLNQPRRLFRAG
jgi:hypothetical protein